MILNIYLREINQSGQPKDLLINWICWKA